MSNQKTPEELAKQNMRVGLCVMAFVAFMAGVSFAAVPLYDLFCRVTGFGGTTQVAEALPGTVLERTVTIKFNSDTGRNLPWNFTPEQREIEVNLGAQGITAYEASNRANKPTGGTAIYNVTPLKAGKYFHKIQCFCFDEQVLQPRQTVSMPVLFYVDPAMNDDPNMADVTTITLSYTFFKANSEELDQALEAYYNQSNSSVESHDVNL